MSKSASSSDDDDDEPLLSSPASTSDENEVQNDVFHYTARKFQKVNHSVGPSPASTGNQRRRRQVDTVQTKLGLLEHQQQQRDKKLRKRLNNVDHDDSSDDDDMDDKARAASQVSKAQAPHAVNAITIDISDDSDDEVKPSCVSLTALKQAPREVLEVLQKSQLATNRLQRAQLYHAEDVEVQVESLHNHNNINIQSRTNNNTYESLRHNRKQAEQHLEASLTNPIKLNLGKKLQLTCRCQLKLNGSNQPTLEKNVTVHENQNLSALLDKVLLAFSLPTTARVTLVFDGLVLDSKRTAASYEMEDGDLVDINASVIAMPTNNTAMSPAGPGQPVGPKLSLTLRCRVDSKVHETTLQLGKNEVFQTLLDRYVRQQSMFGKCNLHFDGEALRLDQTRHPTTIWKTVI
eukprot:CAMPEP_0170395666 /NCGR_PEP_ID=MMETSP0117_2-20130122/21896_1 /TAXON_ID=400756 /ORGANISM="Durinskia baltica, Strain CSIRO CS-38" /LENGTH=404 /DNA_ID=CAMNT_0010651983 /DNA_START=50 /DNA_END=1264 /DNA_ORIENTATION=-